MSLSTTSLCATLIVVLTLVHSGISLKCFSCSSKTDPRCNDYFDKTYHSTRDCEVERHNHPNEEPFCKKLVYTEDHYSHHNETMRGCSWASSQDIDSICREALPNYSSRQLHCSVCRRDGCNGAHGPTSPSSISVLASLLPALLAAAFKVA